MSNVAGIYTPQTLHMVFCSKTYDPGAGSCNLYNGQNASLASSVIVPLEMQAGLSLTNPEFAGSCGRYLTEKLTLAYMLDSLTLMRVLQSNWIPNCMITCVRSIYKG